MTKKPRQPRDLPSDFGTPERLKKADAEDARFERTGKELGAKKRLRIVNQMPLDRYYTRQQINRRQYEAGKLLYSIWYRAGQSQRIASNYAAVIVDGGSGDSQGAGEAFSEYIRALRYVGVDLSKVAQWVVIEGMSANDWAKEKGHDPKGGIVALRLCLDGLGDYFKMARD
tara:strand:- start:99 stop:611 length:513 start_codon:yes stop_codon:yes gene_type:complete